VCSPPHSPSGSLTCGAAVCSAPLPYPICLMSHLAVVVCLHMGNPAWRPIIFIAAHLCDAVAEQQEHRAAPYGGLWPSCVRARPPACCFAAACYCWSLWECCMVG
jgi:hypothetical protein